MSHQAVSAVLAHSKAKGSDRLVLLVLAAHASEGSFECYPGRELLCQESAMSERNLIYCLNSLEEMGELVISRGNGRGHLTTYRIRLEKVKAIAPFSQIERVQDSVKTVQDSAPLPAEKVQAAAPLETERVQDLAERVQNPVIKGAKSVGAYKDIEPSGTIKEQEQVSVAVAPVDTQPSKPAGKTRQKSVVPPAIAFIRQLTYRYPDKTLWDRITQALGEDFDQARLTQCYENWVSHGWNKMNLAWLFDWYVKGIPQNQNGRASPIPANGAGEPHSPVVTAPAEWRKPKLVEKGAE